MIKRKAVLLRGVTPNGKSKIPDMSYLAQILEDAGFHKVKVYLQTGNLILETSMEDEEVRALVHETIYEKLGADVSAVIMDIGDMKEACLQNPFKDIYDKDCVKLLFTNDYVDENIIKAIDEQLNMGEKIVKGEKCVYIYIPKEIHKRALNNNFLERKLRITSTMRKIAVIERFYSI